MEGSILAQRERVSLGNGMALRLLSAWAVVTLSAGCIFTLLHLTGKAHSFRRWLYFAVLTFTALCFY